MKENENPGFKTPSFERISTMKKGLFISMMFVGFVTFQGVEAKADIPDCTTQDDCVAVLGPNDVTVLRYGEVKGVVTLANAVTMGRMSASHGWIVVTEAFSQYVFFYNLADGTTCNPNVMALCTDAVIWKHPTDPSFDQAFLACQNNGVYVRVTLSDCQYTHMNAYVSNPNSIAAGPDWVYVMNEDGGSVAMWDPLNDQSALTQIQNLSSGFHIRYWDNGADPPLVMFIVGNTIYSKSHLQSANAQTVYSFPRDIESVPMAINQTHAITADQGHEAYISTLPNATTHVMLNVNNPRSVSMTQNTAFVTDSQGSGMVKAFDLNGNALYASALLAIDVAGIFPDEASSCGNGLLEGVEVCDGSDLGMMCNGTSCSPRTCESEGFDLGTLACNNSCNMLDTTGCSYECGNASADGPEECDMSDLKNQTCESLGYMSGTLSCSLDCTFDVSQCEACGNNRIDGEEVCDGTNMAGQTCEDLGFSGGELNCNNSCDGVNTAGCTECGNNVLEGDEACEGENLNGNTCESLGFGAGTLLCSNTCALDTSLCPPPVVVKKEKGCSCSGGASHNGILFVFLILLFVAGRRKLKG